MSKTIVEMIVSNHDPSDEYNLWDIGDIGYIDKYVERPDSVIIVLVVLGDRVVICSLSDFKTLKVGKSVKIKNKK